MPTKVILGKTVYEAPRRLIASADCWLSEDERWIVCARKEEDTFLDGDEISIITVDGRLVGSYLRWKADDERTDPKDPCGSPNKGIHS